MENNNSVCFVSQINDLKPIEGADNIEVAFIEGWNCIVPKNVYKVGDMVICATTDAVIPEKLSGELNIKNYLRGGSRVRTVKLRGVYSECLIIPITYLNNKKCYLGADVMDQLGIFKYEPPIKQITLASGKRIKYSDNPNFSIYYKFPNLKNVQGIFTENDEVQITRKLHGTNARFGIVKKSKLTLWEKIKYFFTKNELIKYEYIVGSHNAQKGSDSIGYYDTNVWFDISNKYEIKEKLLYYMKHCAFKNSIMFDEVGSGIIIYGEIYGAGIQKGYDYGLSDIKFAGFDVVVNGQYLSTTQSKYIIEGILSLHYVEVLYNGKWSKEIQDKFILKNYIKGTKIPHEGIVIKHVNGNRTKVAKVINPEYLTFSEKHDIGDSH